MSRIEEQLSEQFYRWEVRGRGWQVFDYPVTPEPPFRPFYGHFLPSPEPAIDDGRKPTFLSSLFRRRPTSPVPPRRSPADDADEEPQPEPLQRARLTEIKAFPPTSLAIERDRFEQFLLSLSRCREPVAFELVAGGSHINAQFVAHPADVPLLHAQLQAFFPETLFVPQDSALDVTWDQTAATDGAVVEFGLEHEFLLSLATRRIDPFVALTAGLAEAGPGELGLYQVLFQRAGAPWAEHALRAVTDAEGKPFFANVPELVRETQKKMALPLFAVVLRLAAKAPDYDRAWEIIRSAAAGLQAFARPGGNELIPLQNDDYDLGAHEADVVRRQSRRSGMLLTSEELIGLVHLPSSDVRLPQLRRQTTRTKPAPPLTLNPDGLLLGHNVHAERSTPVYLTPEHRVRHVHVIGASGTGKSTLLLNLIRQDIENGEGLAVLDPHGDLVDRILGMIPPERVSDVVLVDPADEEWSVGFNILSAHSDLEKNLLASDLVSVFQRLSTSWGDQMGSVLNNAILAFLESSRGGTLADLRRFLLEPGFRNDFLETVTDPELVYYWHKGYPQLAGNKSIGPVLTRLETFLSPKPIRYMVSQRVNRLDFADILDTGKILLAKLSQGLLGRENSYLLGTLLVSKFQQLAMARQAQVEARRRDFWLYLDEFHNFITPSMAEILAGARKYRIGLVLAHQELRQLQRDSEVASAVLSNSGTRICFRLGDDDARKLAEGFSFFEARDLQNLGIGEAIVRIERSDGDFNLTVPPPPDLNEAEAGRRRAQVIDASRHTYGTPKAEVAAALAAALAGAPAPTAPSAHGAHHRDPVDGLAGAPAPTAPSARRPPQPEVAKVAAKSPAQPQPTKPSPPATPLSADTTTAPRPAAPPTAPTPTPQVAEVATPAPEVTETREGAAPPDAAAHEAIKERICRHAENLDYTVAFEEFVPGTQGRADLVLRRGSRTLACEVSVTTTAEHEVANVVKCLTGGYPYVALVCQSPRKLANLEQAIRAAIPASDAARLGFYTLDELLARLDEWATQDPQGGALDGTKPRKQKISLAAADLTEAERKQRERAMLQTLKEAMKRGKGPSPSPT